jgi:GTP-binding protein
MAVASVAIVGRPNVGKSSLLNRLAGRRVAIVEPTPGVTRDRVTIEIRHAGRRFELTDTGGLGLFDEIDLKAAVEAQIATAIDRSDLVLFVVDGKEGSVPGDQLAAERLRRAGRPVLLVVNKVESRSDELGLGAWLRLGFGEPVAVSALEGHGTTDLLDAIVQRLPARPDEQQERPPGLYFAIVGKRNSGKSTLINALAGEPRVIVSEIPGTTRDAVDVEIEWDGRRLVAIDTAGVRKKGSLQDAIELFSYTRATESIRRAQVAVLLFDVTETISQVDKKIAAYCVQHHKPVVLAGNKTDLADRVDLTRWEEYIHQQLPGLDHAPVCFLSARDGRNLETLLELVLELHEQANLELPTPRLNQVLQEAKTRLLPRSRGLQPKLFYGTQIGRDPLRILIFVNEPKLFRGQYDRYLQNRLRDAFDCAEVPLQLVFRRREKVRLEPE